MEYCGIGEPRYRRSACTLKSWKQWLGAFREFCSIDPKLHLNSFAVAKLHQKSYFFYSSAFEWLFQNELWLAFHFKACENNRCFQEVEVREVEVLIEVRGGHSFWW